MPGLPTHRTEREPCYNRHRRKRAGLVFYSLHHRCVLILAVGAVDKADTIPVGEAGAVPMHKVEVMDKVRVVDKVDNGAIYKALV